MNADDWEEWLAREVPELAPALSAHGLGSVVVKGRWLELRFVLGAHLMHLRVQLNQPRSDKRYPTNAARQKAYRKRQIAVVA